MIVGPLLSAAIALALWTGPAQAGATVRLKHPEHYLHTTPNSVAGIKAYLELLGASLAPGLVLNVAVLDLQMAGNVDEFRPPLRIMSGVTWPSIRLRYALTEGRKVIASGEERLGSTLYQQDAAARTRDDPLRYEKAMLRDWYDARFRAYRRKAGG
jgi:hypothetical protein